MPSWRLNKRVKERGEPGRRVSKSRGIKYLKVSKCSKITRKFKVENRPGLGSGEALLGKEAINRLGQEFLLFPRDKISHVGNFAGVSFSLKKYRECIIFIFN